MAWIQEHKLLIAWILFLFLTYIGCYFIYKYMTEHSVVARIHKDYKDKKTAKRENELRFISRFGSIENTSFAYRIDRKILTSGIKQVLPWLSGGSYLIISFLASATVFVITIVFFHNILLSIFCAVAVSVALYSLILAFSAYTYNRIEDSTSVFVSLLCNHAKTSSDIVTVMQEAHGSITGPIRGIVEEFLKEAERNGDVDIAFDYMKELTDNRQLQTIIMNLKNCMHYQANYEDVLLMMRAQITANLSAREERKNMLFSMKITVFIVSIAAIFIVTFISGSLGINLKAALLSPGIGQFLLFLTGLLYLFVFVKLFATDL